VRSPEGAVLTFLLNALWQLPLLAAVAWSGAFLLRRAPAAFRHRVWVAALGLGLLVPLVSAARPSKRDVTLLVGRGPWSAAALDVLRPGAAGARGEKDGASRTDVSRALVRATAVGYLLFVTTLSVRLLRGWRRTERIARGAQPAPAALVAMARECARLLDVRDVALCVSGAVAAPMTVGIRRPLIVLPARFAEAGSAEAVRGVLAHELAHVRRSDCAVNLLCEVFALPLAFHPVVRLLRRLLAGARETACDEAAASLVGARPYATTLLDMAVLASRPARLAGALGALDGDCLEDRMRKVLETQPRLGRRRAGALLLAAGFVMAFAGRTAVGAAVQVATEPGPSDMVGKWTGQFTEGDRAGKRAADLAIALGPNGPVIDLTLYRYEVGSGEAATPEHPPLFSHRVEKGVLYFRTRDKLQKKDGLSEVMEADWDFSVVGTDAGQLRVTLPKLAAERAKGKDVPPPPPPLLMKRVR
jgi:beta-lactamase regulating signal transducer with metallopeptidase domain